MSCLSQRGFSWLSRRVLRLLGREPALRRAFAVADLLGEESGPEGTVVPVPSARGHLRGSADPQASESGAVSSLASFLGGPPHHPLRYRSRPLERNESTSYACSDVGDFVLSLPAGSGGFQFRTQFMWRGPSSPAPCPATGFSATNALDITIQP